MGSSKPWPDAMEALTGQREMSALPLLDYFRPLQEWLEKENKRTGEYIGWKIPSTDAMSSTEHLLVNVWLSALAFMTAIFSYYSQRI